MAEPQPMVQPSSTRRSTRIWAGLGAAVIALFATLTGASAQLPLADSGQAAAASNEPAAAPAGSTWDVPKQTAGAIAPAAGSTDLPTPPGTSPPAGGGPPAEPIIAALAADGIPSVALDAYRRAARSQPSSCGLPWPLLAAIGRVESDHGRFGGALLRTDGTSTRKVIGIPLDGIGSALIRDSDGGRLDGDLVFDRAVGPMQFIPSTWAGYGVDGNGDDVVDPFNIYDAAAAAAGYLCAAGGDLSTSAGQIRAVRAYNDSSAYLANVFALEKAYAAGVPGVTIPILGVEPAPDSGPTLPPVNPGPPLATTDPALSS
ncbi:MAG: lytic murein transglycosylase, partial [Actinomycetota bacterium]